MDATNHAHSVFSRWFAWGWQCSGAIFYLLVSRRNLQCCRKILQKFAVEELFHSVLFSIFLLSSSSQITQQPKSTSHLLMSESDFISITTFQAIQTPLSSSEGSAAANWDTKQELLFSRRCSGGFGSIFMGMSWGPAQASPNLRSSSDRGLNFMFDLNDSFSYSAIIMSGISIVHRIFPPIRKKETTSAREGFGRPISVLPGCFIEWDLWG